MTEWSPERVQRMTDRLERLFVDDEIIEAEMAHGELDDSAEEAVEHRAEVDFYIWIQHIKKQS